MEPPTQPPATAGWWGEGQPPWERWPGRSLVLPGVMRNGRIESPCGQFWFDTEAANKACAFFPAWLRHHIGEFAGAPFTLMPYQEMLLTRPIFGWKRVSDNLRRFRKVFAFLPKGAGKSPWGAGTGLYLAFCDGEPGAEVYAVAADKQQARTVHDNARYMVEAMFEIDPEFKNLLVVYRDSIDCDETKSTYKVISADAATKHGFRPHGVIFDEMHAQKNRNLYEALKKSMVKRRQPLMVIITHAGHDDEGICFEEYAYAKGVLNGTIEDESCLPVIFEMSPDDRWDDPQVWGVVNPGHGITVKHEAIAQEAREAKAEPRKLNDFLMFHGNRWVNQATAWIPVDWWDACRSDFTDADVAGLQCAAGLDLSIKHDISAFVIAFREVLPSTRDSIEVVDEHPESGQLFTKMVDLNYRITLLPFFWIPEDTMREHERTDRVPYQQWRDAGLVVATEGDAVDYSRIYQDITQVFLKRFPKLKQAWLGYDQFNAHELSQNLQNRAHLKVHVVPQSYQGLSEAAHTFEALIRAGRVRHDGHRVLRNHMANVTVKRDDSNRLKTVRSPKPSRHIDGCSAALMAVRGLILTPFQRKVVGVTMI